MENTLREAVLHLDPRQLLVKTELVYDGGRRQVKHVYADELAESLRQCTRTAPVATGLLPPGCLAVRYHNAVWDVTLLSEPARCDVTYQKTVFRDFPLPRFAVRCCVSSKGNIGNVRLAIVGQGVVSPESRLYTCPFPNVSGVNLCIGSNTLTGYDSLYKLRTLPHRLMAIPFGDDYYRPENNRPGLPARELFEYLSDKTPEDYYRSVLVRSNRTLADFIA